MRYIILILAIGLIGCINDFKHTCNVVVTFNNGDSKNYIITQTLENPYIYLYLNNGCVAVNKHPNPDVVKICGVRTFQNKGCKCKQLTEYSFFKYSKQ